MASQRFVRAKVSGGFASVLALAACNEVLGIDSAHVDPRLTSTAASAGVSGNTSGASGSAGRSPAAGSAGLDSAGGSATHSHGAGTAGKPVSPDGDGGESVGQGGSGGSGGSSGGKSASGGTNNQTTNGEGGDAGDMTTEPVDPCDEYCDLMIAECEGEAAQYRDRAQCMRICSILPVGAADRPDENSVACRLKYAQKTRYNNGTEVTNYCRQAGPSGDDTCGTTCQGFCTVMADVCTEESAGIYHFETNEDCLTTCNWLPPAPVEYSSTDPRVSDGDHAFCRLFHVTSAAMYDADEHCEHAMGVTLCQAAP